MKTKLTTITLALAMTFIGCTPFNKLRTKEKFSIWTVVEKYDAPDGGCIYYWNRGANWFITNCNTYQVGDTIKHQQQILKGRIVK